MTKIVITSTQGHRNLRVDATASTDHGDDPRFVQLVKEVPMLAWRKNDRPLQSGKALVAGL